jgi:hypothetical protein
MVTFYKKSLLFININISFKTVNKISNYCISENINYKLMFFIIFNYITL